MAISAAATWECRTTGSDTANSGGFVTGSTGTDFSQQDAAQYSGTDLASTNGNAASPVVTSATHNFVAADVGNILRITAGTSWTAGFYQIVSVATNAATLDRACGSAATLSAGSYAVGGALATPGQAASAMAAGNDLYIKSGTYLITSATANVAGGCLSLPAGATAANTTKLIGYGATRGDGGTRPILRASGIATFTLLTCANVNSVENLELDGASLTSSRGLSAAAASSVRVYKCLLRNWTNIGLITNGSNTNLSILCEVTGCSGSLAAQGGSFLACSFHDNTTTGCQLSNTGGSASFCLATNNTGATSDGFEWGGAGHVLNCTAYGNGRHGFFNTLSTALIFSGINCLAVNNSGYGFSGTAAEDNHYLYNCAGYNNTSGNVNAAMIPAAGQIGFIALSADPFANAAVNDFSLNAAAGGGAALRAAGVPGAFPGGTTTGYADIGTAQHADPAGGPSTLVFAGRTRRFARQVPILLRRASVIPGASVNTTTYVPLARPSRQVRTPPVTNRRPGVVIAGGTVVQTSYVPLRLPLRQVRGPSLPARRRVAVIAGASTVQQVPLPAPKRFLQSRVLYPVRRSGSAALFQSQVITVNQNVIVQNRKYVR